MATATATMNNGMMTVPANSGAVSAPAPNGSMALTTPAGNPGANEPGSGLSPWQTLGMAGTATLSARRTNRPPRFEAPDRHARPVRRCRPRRECRRCYGPARTGAGLALLRPGAAHSRRRNDRKWAGKRNAHRRTSFRALPIPAAGRRMRRPDQLHPPLTEVTRT